MSVVRNRSVRETCALSILRRAFYILCQSRERLRAGPSVGLGGLCPCVPCHACALMMCGCGHGSRAPAAGAAARAGRTADQALPDFAESEV